MTRDDLNLLACALLDVLPDEGAPESYVYLAAEQAGITPAGDAIAVLINLGFVKRTVGPRIGPGPNWSAAKFALENARKQGLAPARAEVKP